MPRRDPPRIGGFDYLGTYRYFVTCCTDDRQPLFVEPALVRDLMLQTQHTCDQRGFALLAYVCMPDHLHLLLEGRFTTSDFRSTMTLLRQRTAIAFHKYHRLTPWQHGYYERVLRAEEETEIVAGYIVANPVRAGLVNRIEDYPFSFCWQPVRFESG